MSPLAGIAEPYHVWFEHGSVQMQRSDNMGPSHVIRSDAYEYAFAAGEVWSDIDIAWDVASTISTSMRNEEPLA
jgi:hypothetical protein